MSNFCTPGVEVRLSAADDPLRTCAAMARPRSAFRSTEIATFLLPPLFSYLDRCRGVLHIAHCDLPSHFLCWGGGGAYTLCLSIDFGLYFCLSHMQFDQFATLFTVLFVWAHSNTCDEKARGTFYRHMTVHAILFTRFNTVRPQDHGLVKKKYDVRSQNCY